jgi:MFS family permease
LNRLFAALGQKQFRYFLTGSFLSNVGSWMQSLALAWLILDLTHSPFYLGLEGFANTIPISVFAFWGGVIADRFDRRKLLIGTQWVMLALALVLGLLTQLHLIRVWQIILLAFIGGLSQSLAWPVYQTVMANVAERQHLTNAIALNSAQFNLARTIGPVVGALGLRYFGRSASSR